MSFRYPGTKDTTRIKDMCLFGNGNMAIAVNPERGEGVSWYIANGKSGELRKLVSSNSSAERPIWFKEDGALFINGSNYIRINADGDTQPFNSQTTYENLYRTIRFDDNKGCIFDKETGVLFALNASSDRIVALNPETMAVSRTSGPIRRTTESALRFIDEKYIYIESSVGIFIFDKRGVLDGTKPNMLIQIGQASAIGHRDEAGDASFMLLGQSSNMLYLFAAYKVPNGNPSSEMFGLVIDKRHIDDWTSSGNTLINSDDASSFVDPEKYPKERIFPYKDSIHGQSTGPSAPEAIREIGKHVLISRKVMSLISTNPFTGKISCINEDMPISRNVFNSAETRYYSVSENKIGAMKRGNSSVRFEEYTPFFIEPIPLFSENIVNEILNNYLERRGNAGSMGDLSTIDTNPTYIDDIYLHLFDAEKYTRFKLIFY